jgi:hypothetical protein
MFALMICLAVTAGASAQTTATQTAATQDKKDKPKASDPRTPDVQKPPATLTDPDSWKTQKEKDEEKKKAGKSGESDAAGKKQDSAKTSGAASTKDAAAAKTGASATAATAAPARSGPSKGWRDRAFISGNGGWQLSSTTFSDSRTLTDAGQVDTEKRTLEADYETKSGPTFDIGGAVRLWGGLGAGVAVTRYSKSGDIGVSGTVPHPFFFNQPRAIDGTTPGKREELAVHVDAVYVVPVNPRLQVAIFGGPSFFNVKQTLVSDYTFSQSYPYDSAAFTGATSAEESKSVTGFNVGADVGYYFTDVIGIGGVIRFSRATFDSSIGKLDVGGPEVAFGVRLRIPEGKGSASPAAPAKAKKK